jgi:hypothetical protein
MVNQYTKDRLDDEDSQRASDDERGAVIRRSCMPMPDVTDPAGPIVGEFFVDTKDKSIVKIGVRCGGSNVPITFPLNVYFVNGLPCIGLVYRGESRRIPMDHGGSEL